MKGPCDGFFSSYYFQVRGSERFPWRRSQKSIFSSSGHSTWLILSSLSLSQQILVSSGLVSFDEPLRWAWLVDIVYFCHIHTHTQTHNHVTSGHDLPASLDLAVHGVYCSWQIQILICKGQPLWVVSSFKWGILSRFLFTKQQNDVFSFFKCEEMIKISMWHYVTRNSTFDIYITVNLLHKMKAACSTPSDCF